MDPFFLPLPLVNPALSDGYDQPSFQQLEQYLDVALCLLRSIAERLRTAVGAEALGPEWNRFLDGNDPIAHSEMVARFDSLVKEKKETEAVRLFREFLLVTWDQAFDLYACWSYWDHARKWRCLQAAELRKLYAALSATLATESRGANVSAEWRASAPCSEATRG